MTEQPHVVIAMSGGVDSSAAAALLREQGYRLTGVMLRLWSEQGREEDNRCCTPDALALARRAAAMLDIPFYALDAREVFRAEVVQAFLDGYTRGVTPNPCLVCNRLVRWGFLLETARKMGADYLASGHYAVLKRGPDGRVQLWRGLDEAKDQSYVLSGLSQNQLARSIFPLGEMVKPEVRALAARLGLPSAGRADSQDLCFLNGEDYRPFLARHAPQSVQPGEMVDREGRVLGRHDGLAGYTIGQRKGLNVPGPEPHYVLAKDPSGNRLVVGRAHELGGRGLETGPVNWISGQAPDSPFEALVKIRYKSGFAAARVTPLADGRARAEFDAPLRDITPGQAAVFYDGRQVVGAGEIL